MPQQRPLPPLSVQTRSTTRQALSKQNSVSVETPLATDETETMSGSTPLNDEIAVGAAARIEDLQEQLSSMRELVDTQQQQISQLNALRTSGSSASKQQTTAFSSAKVPQIAPYSGKREQQTSTRVKAFVYNIRKVGQIGNMDEASMLALADCYFQDRAATWMMGLEASGKKPVSVSDLQEAMVKEFVPPDEQARAKTKLMKLKLNKTVDGYISMFRDLIEICQTPLSEAYLFFFSGLPDEYKEEFTKKYPTGAAENMQDVYEHARTIEMAMQWISKPGKRANPRSNKNADSRNSSEGHNKRDNTPKSGPASSNRNLDRDALSWGPAQQGERTLYRRSARCYDCGGKYTPSHECEGNEKPRNEGPSSSGNSPNA